MNRFVLMRNILFPIFLFLSVGISTISAHDIHVSVTEITISDDGKMDISVRIFFDDLLNACGLSPGEELPSNYTSSDELIEEYISKYFKIFNGKKRIDLEYIESNLGQLAVWIDLQAQIQDFSNELDLNLENTILLDLFDDQINMIHFNFPSNQKKSHILDQSTKVAKLN